MTAKVILFLPCLLKSRYRHNMKHMFVNKWIQQIYNDVSDVGNKLTAIDLNDRYLHLKSQSED